MNTDLALAKSLGLNKQQQLFDEDQKIQKQLKELQKLSESPTPEIAIADLEKLFHMGKLRFMCTLSNLKGSWLRIVLSMLAMAFVAGVFLNTLNTQTKQPTQQTSSLYSNPSLFTQGKKCGGGGAGMVDAVARGFGLSICLIGMFVTIGSLGKNTRRKRVSLVMETIEETSVIIPRGALLKIQENKDKFDSFRICYPKMSVFTKIAVDPAIIGYSPSGSMHLIAVWDIKKDIQEVRNMLSIKKQERRLTKKQIDNLRV